MEQFNIKWSYCLVLGFLLIGNSCTKDDSVDKDDADYLNVGSVLVSENIEKYHDKLLLSDDWVEFSQDTFGAALINLGFHIQDTSANIQAIVIPIESPEDTLRLLATLVEFEELKRTLVVEFSSVEDVSEGFSGSVKYYFTDGALILETVYEDGQLVAQIEGFGKTKLTCFWDCMLLSTGISYLGGEGCAYLFPPCLVPPAISCIPFLACAGLSTINDINQCSYACCSNLYISCPTDGWVSPPNGPPQLQFPYAYSVDNACGGTPPYKYKIDGLTGWGSSKNFTINSAGTYRIRVKDSQNCRDSKRITFE